jgi:hypothetical protein
MGCGYQYITEPRFQLYFLDNLERSIVELFVLMRLAQAVAFIFVGNL